MLFFIVIDLCGEEITADYPHDEVRSVGVNHFPNGVFQKCRIILKREKEEERNRLKRIRRMNTRAGKGFTNSPRMSNNSVVPISAELNTDEFDLDVSTPQGSPSRQPLIREAPRNEAHAHTYNFDQQWNQAVSGMHQQITPTARPSSARAQYYRQQQQRMSSPTTPTITSTINDLNSPTRGRANNNPYVFHD